MAAVTVGVADASASATPILDVRGVSKTFGGVNALAGVSLRVAPHEVHALVGENGSGKSTLIKVLAGFHTPDAGSEILLNGRSLHTWRGGPAFRLLGLAFVHQDLGLISSLSVLENLLLWDLSAQTRRRHISWRRERTRARALFERHDVVLPLDRPVSTLRQHERALLALVRAIAELEGSPVAHEQRGLLVLDEPTTYFGQDEVDQMAAVVRRVAEGLGSVLFISHDIDEVRRLASKVSVLRNGRLQTTLDSTVATKADIVEAMLGRAFEADQRGGARVATEGAPRVRVDHVNGKGVRDVSFDIHASEIVGLTGPLGSGFEEILYLLYGAQSAASGELHIDHEHIDLTTMTPGRAIDEKIVLIPADRHGQGSIGSLSLGDNVALPVLPKYGRWRLACGRLRSEMRSLLQRYRVKPPRPEAGFSSLSGGNQQKAVLAKWLQTSPRLVLLHEPTQGVDVGARRELYDLLTKIAEDGAVLLWASVDHEELARVCTRVAIFSRGQVAAVLEGAGVSKERIAAQCLGVEV